MAPSRPPRFLLITVAAFHLTPTVGFRVPPVRGAPPASKFDAMLAGLCLPSPSALTFVESSSQRTLLRGVWALREDAQVRRAFQILYEDLAVFRPAGDLVLGGLTRCAAKATTLYSEAVSEYDDMLPRLRGLFDAIDVDGDGMIDLDELEAATSHLWPPGVAAQVCLDSVKDGCLVSFSFHEFVLLVAPTKAAARCSPPRRGSMEHSSSQGASGLSAQGNALLSGTTSTASASAGRRFDGMVNEFLTWEREASSWDGRTGEIVMGCFAGASNTILLRALRLVYCENAVLRAACDAVFRMLRSR